MRRPSPYLAYRVVAAVTAGFLLLFGVLFFAAFVDRTLAQVFARPLFVTNHWGHYILGFAGSALIAWGTCLLGVVLRPARSGGVALGTAAGLIVGAVLRLLAWYSGEYRLDGDQLRVEAGLFALLALAFIWLRPPSDAPETGS